MEELPLPPPPSPPADEVPCHFLCPISLQLMSDPVTLPTGITYDRHHIHHWLFSLNHHTCPVTNQPLPADDKLLTPNLTLRRLIHSWRGAPAAPAEPSRVDSLPSTSGSRADDSSSSSLANLARLRLSDSDLKNLISDDNFLDSLIRSMAQSKSKSTSSSQSRAYATILLRSAFRVADPIQLVNARSEIFGNVITVLKDRISEQATKAALKFLIEVCPWGRNRIKAVEAGAVAALIELLMESDSGQGSRRRDEMAVRAAEVMCGCAEGRAELVGHAAGVAVVGKKMLRVSHAATERCVRILSAVSRYAGTGKVVAEMLEVGVVAKLCLVVQVDASWKSKEKAREILRRHSRAWRDSSCIPSHLISSFPL